jgi:starvation-inducible DNA-binding protein
MAASASSLDEYPLDAVEGKETVTAVADRLATYAAAVREAIDTTAELGDQSSSDLFTEISRTADKYLWFVEAHQQG